eukprot:Rmarinus@m.3364
MFARLTRSSSVQEKGETDRRSPTTNVFSMMRSLSPQTNPLRTSSPGTPDSAPSPEPDQHSAPKLMRSRSFEVSSFSNRRSPTPTPAKNLDAVLEGSSESPRQLSAQQMHVRVHRSSNSGPRPSRSLHRNSVVAMSRTYSISADNSSTDVFRSSPRAVQEQPSVSSQPSEPSIVRGNDGKMSMVVRHRPLDEVGISPSASSITLSESHSPRDISPRSESVAAPPLVEEPVISTEPPLRVEDLKEYADVEDGTLLDHLLRPLTTEECYRLKIVERKMTRLLVRRVLMIWQRLPRNGYLRDQRALYAIERRLRQKRAATLRAWHKYCVEMSRVRLRNIARVEKIRVAALFLTWRTRTKSIKRLRGKIRAVMELAVNRRTSHVFREWMQYTANMQWRRKRALAGARRLEAYKLAAVMNHWKQATFASEKRAIGSLSSQVVELQSKLAASTAQLLALQAGQGSEDQPSAKVAAQPVVPLDPETLFMLDDRFFGVSGNQNKIPVAEVVAPGDCWLVAGEVGLRAIEQARNALVGHEDVTGASRRVLLAVYRYLVHTKEVMEQRTLLLRALTAWKTAAVVGETKESKIRHCSHVLSRARTHRVLVAWRDVCEKGGSAISLVSPQSLSHSWRQCSGSGGDLTAKEKEHLVYTSSVTSLSSLGDEPSRPPARPPPLPGRLSTVHGDSLVPPTQLGDVDGSGVSNARLGELEAVEAKRIVTHHRAEFEAKVAITPPPVPVAEQYTQTIESKSAIEGNSLPASQSALSPLGRTPPATLVHKLLPNLVRGVDESYSLLQRGTTVLRTQLADKELSDALLGDFSGGRLSDIQEALDVIDCAMTQLDERVSQTRKGMAVVTWQETTASVRKHAHSLMRLVRRRAKTHTFRRNIFHAWRFLAARSRRIKIYLAEMPERVRCRYLRTCLHAWRSPDSIFDDGSQHDDGSCLPTGGGGGARRDVRLRVRSGRLRASRPALHPGGASDGDDDGDGDSDGTAAELRDEILLLRESLLDKEREVQKLRKLTEAAAVRSIHHLRNPLYAKERELRVHDSESEDQPPIASHPFVRPEDLVRLHDDQLHDEGSQPLSGYAHHDLDAGDDGGEEVRPRHGVTHAARGPAGRLHDQRNDPNGYALTNHSTNGDHDDDDNHNNAVANMPTSASIEGGSAAFPGDFGELDEWMGFLQLQAAKEQLAAATDKVSTGLGFLRKLTSSLSSAERRRELEELKSYRKPPKGGLQVMAALLLLLNLISTSDVRTMRVLSPVDAWQRLRGKVRVQGTGPRDPSLVSAAAGLDPATKEALKDQRYHAAAQLLKVVKEDTLDGASHALYLLYAFASIAVETNAAAREKARANTRSTARPGGRRAVGTTR